VSHAIDIDPGAQDAIAALPHGALVALVEAFAVLELAPWSAGRSVNPERTRRGSCHRRVRTCWLAPAGATLYSSLEPCSARASRPLSCTELIVAAVIAQVVFAWREPELFVHGEGAERLRTAEVAEVEVVELGELADAARVVNLHLPV
jgi:pyrimidine deaminase RibD-like protein